MLTHWGLSSPVVVAHDFGGATTLRAHLLHGCDYGRTAKSDYDAYTAFMQERAAPDYSSVEGNLACYFLRRLDDDAAHFLLITHWESMEAIKAFAGPDPETAKYYPEDDEFLPEKEQTSQLYEVFHHADT